MSGWQEVYEDLADDLVIIAAAQDTGGAAVAREWYELAKTTYVSLVDETHTVSALYGLVNVPSAVWIDESGTIRRIDEGTYSKLYKTDDFEFGRDDYAPMLADWVANGDASAAVQTPVELGSWAAKSDEQALADPNFKLGVYFHRRGDEDKANHYWETAQALDPSSWNYARQDWSFTPEQAGKNFQDKYQTLGDKPYYKPIEGLEAGAGED